MDPGLDPGVDPGPKPAKRTEAKEIAYENRVGPIQMHKNITAAIYSIVRASPTAVKLDLNTVSNDVRHALRHP